ncbi:SAM-dependent methyltransferase [Mesoflavibacter sp. HG96]|uniref:THUMP-like domain-containing protein n=1 Tax=unclassified Mesoflavibacter TaxID=2630131 RepID=UPI000D0F1612|nr:MULTISPECIES: SAM-dependent methyltransferase [unclassified Mesoflavibacter]QIJ90193.1 SAM-dependent methyltransferase [Mesoflavibacter sp. HG96]QIJ92921.1 SAM-dependent methyltransferase [Mesoflavibacter sp. HG37]
MINFNKEILNIEIQEFIKNNINSNISELILKGLHFSSEISSEIINQIEAKNRCKNKLNTWFETDNIYYPNKLNIEQTSSEVTAKHKASLIKGKSLIDVTGGFGVDCFYFAKQFETVMHCELNTDLSKIVAHNNSVFKIENINCVATNGIDYIINNDTTYDWIYIDPSRRNDAKGKVFMLSDCLPNVPQHLDNLFEKSNNIMIKTSPLLDISLGIKELDFVKEIHCIAVNNEVKELLWILDKGFDQSVKIITTNIKKDKKHNFVFFLNEEANATVNYSKPLTYLYEPNSAVLKSGAFNSIAEQLNVFKLHKHSHLYTNEQLIDFPGRRFKIETIAPYNKKKFKQQFKLDKANFTTRNFPETVAQLRQKLKVKDGGTDYLFFTTDEDNNKIVIHCTKA